MTEGSGEAGAAAGAPAVSAVVVQFGSADLLASCLDSLLASRLDGGGRAELEIVVVTSGRVRPEVATVCGERGLRPASTGENRGYGAACNLGARRAAGRHLLFLNDDVRLDPRAVARLVAALEADPRIAAVQPRMLSAVEPGRLDYAGAAGGLLDLLGYPFARGRLFDTVEEDGPRWDQSAEIFWASGAAMLCRADPFRAVGGFAEELFLYMEEIDLAWRLQRRGARLRYVGGARAWHVGGRGPGRESDEQMFLNHRNNLIVLVRNYPPLALALLLPVRLALELATILRSLAADDGRRGRAVLRALGWLTRRPATLARLRREARRGLPERETPPWRRLYRRPVAVEYFLRGRRTLDELPAPIRPTEQGPP